VERRGREREREREYEWIALRMTWDRHQWERTPWGHPVSPAGLP
jgi:hypothetical protein